MTNLPVEQISESQRLASELHIEPDAKVMQGHFGGQTCLKAVQGMGTLTGKPKQEILTEALKDYFAKALREG